MHKPTRSIVPADAGFAVGSAALNPRLAPVLAQLTDGLMRNPTETVQVVGYTDNTGGDAINIPLSRSRARSVCDDLVAHASRPSGSPPPAWARPTRSPATPLPRGAR